MKYQRGDCGATLMIAMVVLMVGYFTFRGHDGGGMHHSADKVPAGAENSLSAISPAQPTTGENGT